MSHLSFIFESSERRREGARGSRHFPDVNCPSRIGMERNCIGNWLMRAKDSKKNSALLKKTRSRRNALRPAPPSRVDPQGPRRPLLVCEKASSPQCAIAAGIKFAKAAKAPRETRRLRKSDRKSGCQYKLKLPPILPHLRKWSG